MNCGGRGWNHRLERRAFLFSVHVDRLEQTRWCRLLRVKRGFSSESSRDSEFHLLLRRHVHPKWPVDGHTDVVRFTAVFTLKAQQVKGSFFSPSSAFSLSTMTKENHIVIFWLNYLQSLSKQKKHNKEYMSDVQEKKSHFLWRDLKVHVFFLIPPWWFFCWSPSRGGQQQAVGGWMIKSGINRQTLTFLQASCRHDWNKCFLLFLSVKSLEI